MFPTATQAEQDAYNAVVEYSNKIKNDGTYSEFLNKEYESQRRPTKNRVAGIPSPAADIKANPKLTIKQQQLLATNFANAYWRGAAGLPLEKSNRKITADDSIPATSDIVSAVNSLNTAQPQPQFRGGHPVINRTGEAYAGTGHDLSNMRKVQAIFFNPNEIRKHATGMQREISNPNSEYNAYAKIPSPAFDEINNPGVDVDLLRENYANAYMSGAAGLNRGTRSGLPEGQYSARKKITNINQALLSGGSPELAEAFALEDQIHSAEQTPEQLSFFVDAKFVNTSGSQALPGYTETEPIIASENQLPIVTESGKPVVPVSVENSKLLVSTVDPLDSPVEQAIVEAPKEAVFHSQLASTPPTKSTIPSGNVDTEDLSSTDKFILDAAKLKTQSDIQSFKVSQMRDRVAGMSGEVDNMLGTVRGIPSRVDNTVDDIIAIAKANVDVDSPHQSRNQSNLDRAMTHKPQKVNIDSDTQAIIDEARGFNNSSTTPSEPPTISRPKARNRISTGINNYINHLLELDGVQ